MDWNKFMAVIRHLKERDNHGKMWNNAEWPEDYIW